MRYEHIELDISTATCDAILRALDFCDPGLHEVVAAEVLNFKNELRARLQRRDEDARCNLNNPKVWLDD